MNLDSIIEFPLPPRSRTAASDLPVIPEEVVITTLSGRTITGLLTRFKADAIDIEFIKAHDKTNSRLLLTEIKFIQLVNTRQFIADELKMEDGDAGELPPERQEYELLYTDDTNELGETFGYIEDKAGVHIFVTQAFNSYMHQFIPHTALKDYRVGPQIGQILVEKKKLTPEQLNTGLQKQQELRTQKLGEYFMAEAIVTPAQLEAVLSKQQSRPNLRLGEALILDKLITEAQLGEALEKQKQNRSTPLGAILIAMGVVSEIDVRKTLANKLGIPFINLRKYQFDPSVVTCIPEKVMRRHKIIPVAKFEHKILIAVDDPLNRAPIEDVRFHTQTYVEPVMALKEDIEWAINKLLGTQISELARELDDDGVSGDEFHEPEVADSDNALVKLVNKMITDANSLGASDIHIEPGTGKKTTVVRFRKDGSLVPYVELPPTYRNAIVSRIKIMSNLDISERRMPQDGKIDFKKFGNVKLELRVATIPTAGGVEDVVMRLLANSEPLPPEKLGLNQYNVSNIRTLITKPYGLFLVCGPTGSGKTTTLHSLLSTINQPDRKIWTAEDPVEITQTGLRQVQVNPKIKLDFASAMRAFLRADPDVIMVGEMRDEETTETGIEASLTGHLVFSTLHTNSAPESIVRLLEMGMDPFNFADALLGVLAQRLVKKLCPLCKKPHVATNEELAHLYYEYFSEMLYADSVIASLEEKQGEFIAIWKKQYGNPNGEIILYDPVGCDDCNNHGYSGRFGIHELLVATHAVKKLIQERSTVAELLVVATSEGMTTLKQDGIHKVMQGLTDLRQIHAVCIK